MSWAARTPTYLWVARTICLPQCLFPSEGRAPWAHPVYRGQTAHPDRGYGASIPPTRSQEAALVSGSFPFGPHPAAAPPPPCLREANTHGPRSQVPGCLPALCEPCSLTPSHFSLLFPGRSKEAAVESQWLFVLAWELSPQTRGISARTRNGADLASASMLWGPGRRNLPHLRAHGV